MVRARINGRVFSLNWAEFESALSRLSLTASVEILEAS